MQKLLSEAISFTAFDIFDNVTEFLKEDKSLLNGTEYMLVGSLHVLLLSINPNKYDLHTQIFGTSEINGSV